MFNINIKTNSKDVALAIQNKSKKVKASIQKALDASQMLVWNKALHLAPADSGQLRRQIKPASSGSPFKRLLKSNAKYSIFVHEGTRKWPLSKPPKAPGTVRQFFKVAEEQSHREAAAIFQKAINNAVK